MIFDNLMKFNIVEQNLDAYMKFYMVNKPVTCFTDIKCVYVSTHFSSTALIFELARYHFHAIEYS